METTQPSTGSDFDVTRLATGAGISLVGRLVGRAANAISQVALARLLGPESFGLYAIGWTILQISGAIASFGLDKGVVRYGVLYREMDHTSFKEALFLCISLAMIGGAVVGGSLCLAAPWLAEQVLEKPHLTWVIRWFAPGVALYAGLRVAAAATRIAQHMQYSIYAEEALQPGANLLLIGILLSGGWGPLGAIIAALGSFGVALLLALYYVRRLFASDFSWQVPSLSVMNHILSFSLPTSFAGVFMLLLIWMDRLLVSYFCSMTEVGVYQAVSQLSFLLAIILNAFNMIFSPLIADLYAKRQFQRLDELFKVSTKWGLYLSLPPALVLILAPCEMMEFIFGQSYETGSLPLTVLILAQLINVGTGAVDHLLVMTGQQQRWCFISAVMLLVNIIIGAFLIPRLGLVGAALGSACGFGGLFLLGLFEVRRTLGLWPYDGRYVKGGVAAALATGALLLLRPAAVGPQMLNIALLITVSLGIFAATLALLGLDKEDRMLLAKVRIR